MSRGPGQLGRAILHELHEAPGHRLQWSELKRRFPIAVRQKSWYRAMRTLRRLRRVFDYEAGGQRYVQLAPVYESGGRYHFVYADDRELLALVTAAHRQLALIAKARGVPVPLPPLTQRGLTERGNPKRPEKTNPEA